MVVHGCQGLFGHWRGGTQPRIITMHSTIVRYGSSLICCVAFACGSEPNRPTNTADDVAMTPAQGMTPASQTTPGSSEPGGEVAPGNDPAATDSTATPAAVRLSASQIAMVTELVNTAEIEQGQLAQSKGKSASVKKFGAMMVKHHSEAKSDQAKLYKELKLTPEASSQGNLLKGDADRIMGTLRGAEGEAFDVAYMNSQVDAHQKVLDTLNRELLPAANDEKLRDSLEDMKDAVESHLKEARAIQADLVRK
jgi:putative membrane protein